MNASDLAILARELVKMMGEVTERCAYAGALAMGESPKASEVTIIYIPKLGKPLPDFFESNGVEITFVAATKENFLWAIAWHSLGEARDRFCGKSAKAGYFLSEGGLAGNGTVITDPDQIAQKLGEAIPKKLSRYLSIVSDHQIALQFSCRKAEGHN